MVDDSIGVDERALDDAALEALAEIYATTTPPVLRERVLAEARRDAAALGATRVVRRWQLVGGIAAGAALVLGALLARESRFAGMRAARLGALARTNAELTARLDEQGRALAGLREAVAGQAQVLRVLAALRTLSAALTPQQGARGGGRVLVDAASGEAALVVSGLAPAGESKIYELWAIRGERPPEPAGLFSVNAEGAVATRVERVGKPAEVSAFAVSIEPAGGSKAPTGPIVLVGAVAG